MMSGEQLLARSEDHGDGTGQGQAVSCVRFCSAGMLEVCYYFGWGRDDERSTGVGQETQGDQSEGKTAFLEL